MSAVISTITIDSLLNCLLESEIIVIDNASTDGSLDALVGLPCVQIIKAETDAQDNLNQPNRRMRTRMSGGVGGE